MSLAWELFPLSALWASEDCTIKLAHMLVGWRAPGTNLGIVSTPGNRSTLQNSLTSPSRLRPLPVLISPLRTSHWEMARLSTEWPGWTLVIVHPPKATNSYTNQAWCWLTLSIWPASLPLCQTSHTVVDALIQVLSHCFPLIFLWICSVYYFPSSSVFSCWLSPVNLPSAASNVQISHFLYSVLYCLPLWSFVFLSASRQSCTCCIIRRIKKTPLWCDAVVYRLMWQWRASSSILARQRSRLVRVFRLQWWRFRRRCRSSRRLHNSSSFNSSVCSSSTCSRAIPFKVSAALCTHWCPQHASDKLTDSCSVMGDYELHMPTGWRINSGTYMLYVDICWVVIFVWRSLHHCRAAETKIQDAFWTVWQPVCR